PGEVDYAALPVIARAAASIKPDGEAAADNTPWLIAAMFSGGYDRNAARWAGALDALSAAAKDRSWALLATGAPETRVDLSAKRIESFVKQDESLEGRLGHFLVAALGGLDRLPRDQRADLLQRVSIDTTPRTLWARMISASAARGEKGTVALLAAAGLQAANWNDVPPVQLYFITAALHRVGLDPYARMIAAEAMARTG
ncbi:MAG: hypothetical protein J7498_16395, partial [Sphingobium sp.]|nr:hypothetical protein [Sphingobium sp.]